MTLNVATLNSMMLVYWVMGVWNFGLANWWIYTNIQTVSCTFPPAHWRLILLIRDFSLVIGGKLPSKYLSFSLLVANYSRNIPFFLHWQPGLQTHAICSLNIPNNSLYNASYYMDRKITSHWQTLFSKKNGGDGLIFLQNWRRRPYFTTKFVAAALFS